MVAARIPIKTDSEIAAMRTVGRITAEVLDFVCRAVQPGISTWDLDRITAEQLALRGAKSAELGYRGSHGPFPAYACISLNEEVVHGIPSRERIVGEGDIVSIDLVASYGGFMGDSTRTVAVGEVSKNVANLLQQTEAALHEGILRARAGNRVGDISAAIQAHAEKHGLGIVREMVGHGIGREMHEEPRIPNFGQAGTGPRLLPGMTLAIEPMFLLGGEKLVFDGDGWTVRSADGAWSAHFEHTILVTKSEPEVLTALKK